MSRIGKQPIVIPQGVSVEINGQNVKVTGPKGTLERVIVDGVKAKIEDNQVKFEIAKSTKELNSLFGTMRAIVQNMVTGVKDGWSKRLELVGTGYRAETTGKNLSILVGYSHPVKFEAPEGITFKVEKTDVIIEGSDREVVGQMAASIRAARPPEPYKGKGVKYKGEVIRRKAGKAAKGAA